MPPSEALEIEGLRRVAESEIQDRAQFGSFRVVGAGSPDIHWDDQFLPTRLGEGEEMRRANSLAELAELGFPWGDIGTPAGYVLAEAGGEIHSRADGTAYLVAGGLTYSSASQTTPILVEWWALKPNALIDIVAWEQEALSSIWVVEGRPDIAMILTGAPRADFDEIVIAHVVRDGFYARINVEGVDPIDFVRWIEGMLP